MDSSAMLVQDSVRIRGMRCLAYSLGMLAITGIVSVSMLSATALTTAPMETNLSKPALHDPAHFHDSTLQSTQTAPNSATRAKKSAHHQLTAESAKSTHQVVSPVVHSLQNKLATARREGLKHQQTILHDKRLKKTLQRMQSTRRQGGRSPPPPPSPPIHDTLVQQKGEMMKQEEQAKNALKTMSKQMKSQLKDDQFAVKTDMRRTREFLSKKPPKKDPKVKPLSLKKQLALSYAQIDQAKAKVQDEENGLDKDLRSKMERMREEQTHVLRNDESIGQMGRNLVQVAKSDVAAGTARAAATGNTAHGEGEGEGKEPAGGNSVQVGPEGSEEGGGGTASDRSRLEAVAQGLENNQPES